MSGEVLDALVAPVDAALIEHRGEAVIDQGQRRGTHNLQPRAPHGVVVSGLHDVPQVPLHVAPRDRAPGVAVVLATRRHAGNPARHHRSGARPELNELRAILSDSITRLLTDEVTVDVRRAAEDGDWPSALWTKLEENGHPRVLVPEDQGGVGGGWLDAHTVIQAAGRFAAPVPIAETILAGRLLADAALDVPDGPITIAPVRPDEVLAISRTGNSFSLSGTVSRVPWGAAAGHLAVQAEADGQPHIALVAQGQAEVRTDRNIAREPRDTLTFKEAPVIAAARTS